GVNTDLWRVTLDGDVENLLPVGEGGATLAVSGAGQVLLGQSGALRRARADGSASATVLNFPQVNTASEWLYYPEPQWTQGGSQAFVAIPGPEPFAAETSATLWLVLPEGPAVQLGTLPGSVLFQPVRWSPDGRRLAYVRAGGGEAALVLGNGDGRETAVYDNAADLATFAWSPNSARFLYAGPGFYAIGQPGEAPLRVQIPAELRVTDMVWLNDERFLTALGSPTSGAWSLYSTDLAGNAAPLHSVAGRELVWDVWAP
ncbi:MAG: PD40 domain-containing protein, partial [Anaerolineales bacterium]|nr:PD40 domain-containing protein [Anaerolineales bacterium]